MEISTIGLNKIPYTTSHEKYSHIGLSRVLRIGWVFLTIKKINYKKMKNVPLIAGLLSLLIPGLGQIYGGKGNKGAAIIFASIVIANLNILILPMIALANPNLPVISGDINAVWKYWIPRITHDVASLWSIVFWIWAVIDAYLVTKEKSVKVREINLNENAIN